MKNNIPIILIEELTFLFIQILMTWIICFFLSIIVTGFLESEFFVHMAKYTYLVLTVFAILRTIYRIAIKKGK